MYCMSWRDPTGNLMISSVHALSDCTSIVAAPRNSLFVLVGCFSGNRSSSYRVEMLSVFVILRFLGCDPCEKLAAATADGKFFLIACTVTHGHIANFLLSSALIHVDGEGLKQH